MNLLNKAGAAISGSGKETGLGLSVSLGIVRSMGGSIDVQGKPGAG